MSDPVTLLEPPPAVLAVIDALRSFDQLVARIGGDADRITTRKPADATVPWIWVRSAGGFALNAARGAWSRTVQIEVCATAPVDGELPELFCERVAALVATYLAGLRAAVYAGASWRPRYLDGPSDLTDTSRGADAPVYRQVVRFDIRQHAHVV